jgi:hypothetical protein
MLLSVAVRCHPHSVLELHHAETTCTASQLETHLQVAPVERFPENHDIIDQSVR